MSAGLYSKNGESRHSLMARSLTAGLYRVTA